MEKRKEIVCLLIFSLSFFRLFCNGEDWNFSNEISTEFPILRAFEQIDKELVSEVANSSQNGITFIIGETGAGKSTLQLLFEEAKKGKEFSELRIIAYKEDQEDLRIDGEGIGHADAARTKAPVFSTSGEFLDFPGFENIEGNDQGKLDEMILSSYALKRSLEIRKKFKIVLVVTETDITERRGELFKNHINTLTRMFPNNAEYIKERLDIVVTHARRNKSKLHERVGRLLQDRKSAGEKFSEDEEMFLNYFSYRDNERLHLLLRPKSLNEKISLDFAHTIVKRRYAGKYSGEIDTWLPAVARERARFHLEEISKVFLQLFKTFGKKLEENFPPVVASHNGSAEELRTALKEKTEILIETKDRKKLESSLSYISAPTSNNFKQYDGMHNTFLQCIPSDMRDQQHHDYGLIERQKLLEKLRKMTIAPKWERIEEGRAIEGGGSILGISDIVVYLRGLEIGKYPIELRCLSEVALLDEDFIANSLNLLWISDFCKIAQKRTVVFSGKDGEVHRTKAENATTFGNPGEDGFPGNPGQNGGHFYGFFEKINDSKENINFKSDGGNGGKGQNGGNGANGKDGEKGTLEEVKTRKNQGKFVNGIQYYVSGTMGTPGGDGGKGGRGGYAGNPGSLKIWEGDRLFINLDGKRGKEGGAGSYGDFGLGGKHGSPIFEGYYYQAGSIGKMIGVVGFGTMGGSMASSVDIKKVEELIEPYFGSFIENAIGIPYIGLAKVGMGLFLGSMVGHRVGSKVDGHDHWKIETVTVKGRALSGKIPSNLNEAGIKRSVFFDPISKWPAIRVNNWGGFWIGALGKALYRLKSLVR